MVKTPQAGGSAIHQEKEITRFFISRKPSPKTEAPKDPSLEQQKAKTEEEFTVH